MKIYAFGVREDERAAFEKYEKEYDLELSCTKEVLSLSNIDLVKGCDGVTILGMHTYGKEELDKLKEYGVKCLTTRSIGYDHIDVAYAREIGLKVCNAAYPPTGVAEYTIMMILLCLRNYKQSLWRTQVNDYSLTGLIGREINHLTIGVVGTGRIGMNVIQALSGFGGKIIAYDPHENEEVKKYATYVSLEEVYAKADVITFHMPLLEDTYHMVNNESIARMKDGVVLINCARGSLMNIDALIENIENCKIGALGLDCIEEEEGIVHRNFKSDIISNRKMAYLRQFPNVVHTQHMAFYTDVAVESMVQYGLYGIMEIVNGRDYANDLTK